MTVLAFMQNAGAAALIVQAVPIIAVVAFFYFIVIAPANKQRRNTEQMLGGLKKGDRVLTSGGIYGSIQGIENDVVQLKIADNVKVKVSRAAITSVLGDSD